MTIKELKSLASQRGLSTKNCTEKDDLIGVLEGTPSLNTGSTEAQWACPACTFLNSTLNDACTVCGTINATKKDVGWGSGPHPTSCGARPPLVAGKKKLYTCYTCDGKFKQWIEELPGAYGFRTKDGTWHEGATTDLTAVPESPNGSFCCSACETPPTHSPPPRRTSETPKSPNAAAPKREVETSTATTEFPLVGQKVTLRGLVGRAELNGSQGHVESYNPATGRYAVSLIGLGQSDRLGLKATNLVTVGQSDVISFLRKVELEAFADSLFAFGVENLSDLCDEDIVSNKHLATESIGMLPAHVTKLRMAIIQASDFASDSQHCATACASLMAAAGPAGDVWRTLRKILGKVASNPSDGRFRRLRESNAAVSTVWSFSPARAVLSAVGFSSESSGVIMLPHGEIENRRVQEVVTYLDDHRLGMGNSFVGEPLRPILPVSPPPAAASAPLSAFPEPMAPIQARSSSESSALHKRVLPESLVLVQLRPERALLGAPIGEGSFGVVYRGTYTQRRDNPPLDVAFKRIKLQSTSADVPPQVVEALSREVQVMQRLNHPNLLRLFAVCDDPHAKDSSGAHLGICLCLEYCDRGAMSDVLGDVAVDLPWALRLKIAEGIVKGMAQLYSHVPVISHRDLKSMNILISEDWEAKVSDFGLAKHRSETTKHTSTSKGGTFRWAAPETFDGTFSEASDVYSCGITLWELCSRKMPYGEMSDQAIMMAVYARQERPDLTLIEAGCPEALVESVKHCWEHDPTARPTFSKLLVDFEANGLSNTSPASLCAAPCRTGPLRADGSSYDVFLSHRQADTQDFVRHLYDVLTEKGFRVFLDRVDANKLHNLPAIVRSSRCLVFVLSDKIFDSKWCLYELRTAVANDIPIIPLRFEGSTWGPSKNNFPDIDADYIADEVTVEGETFEVRPLLRELFKIKAVEHSREYFDGFISRFVGQLPRVKET